MTIQFLSHEEVCELTGARTKAGQILNLKKMAFAIRLK